MSNLLPKLADLIKEEYNLQKKVKDQIVFLKNELEYMEAALIKVSEMPIDRPPDILLKPWARDVRELSYDLEDMIDTFKVHTDTPRQMKEKQFSLGAFLERCQKLLTRAKIHHKLGVNIEEISSRLQDVSARRDRYKIENTAAESSGQTVDTRRLSALYTKAEDLIGVEDKIDELVSELMEGDEPSKQQLKKISIVGFGGLGKTTLAKRVHDKLKDQFDCGAFVSVSLNPNIKNIFKSMLHQLGHYKYEATWDEDQFINELREFLRDKRYFIAIDDIWKTSVWETIKHALVENGRGSRVISTTRYRDVAKKIGGVYELPHLSPADSRKLFYLRIFGSENSRPSTELSEVSDKILKKCGGVPLAIITVASMLASKKGKQNTRVLVQGTQNFGFWARRWS
ncbi:unnamed protein product [Urochloa decumbens]|uniref:Uncharacterized protein n=1 Tax=Urochloa decumbens TaxID=240449 RepID=A0ABC9B285_9POAL